MPPREADPGPVAPSDRGRRGLRLTAAPEDAGRRLDEVLAEALGVGRRAAARLAWRARVNGTWAVKGLRLRSGDDIEVDAEPDEVAAVPDVVREGPEVIVLAKPAGLATVALRGGRGDSLARRLTARFPECATVGPPGDGGLAHRLDAGTSGLLLAARTQRAYEELRAQFRSHRVEKTYLALVRGVPDRTLHIDAAIGQHRHSRRRVRALNTDSARRYAARPALTVVECLRALGEVSLVRATTTTGIRHQIRVHLAGAGHALVNDPLYDTEPDLALIPGFLLHANALRWHDPSSGAAESALLEPPASFRAALARLEGGTP